MGDNIVDRKQTEEKSICCIEPFARCCHSPYSHTSTMTRLFTHLQNLLTRPLRKEENVDSKMLILAELLLFAIAEVFHHRNRAASLLSVSDAPYNGSLDHFHSLHCNIDSVSSESVENLSIFRKYLDKHARSHLNSLNQRTYSFTCNIRKQTILWLLDIGELLDLNSETVALTVAFLDKFVGKGIISAHFLHGTIGGCLCAFSKWVDSRPVSCEEISKVLSISAASIRIFEEIILQSLDWNLQLKTVHDCFSRIAAKFRQLYWDIQLNETTWEQVVGTMEMYLNISLTCEELTTYDHCVVVLVILIVVYKKAFRERYTHEESDKESTIAELCAEIAKNCDISEECMNHMMYLLESERERETICLLKPE